MGEDQTKSVRNNVLTAVLLVWLATGKKVSFTRSQMKAAILEHAIAREVAPDELVDTTTAYSGVASLLATMGKAAVGLKIVERDAGGLYSIPDSTVKILETVTELHELLRPVDKAEALKEPPAPTADPEVDQSLYDDDPAFLAKEGSMHVDTIEGVVLLICSPGMARWVQGEEIPTKQWHLRLRASFSANEDFLDHLAEETKILVKRNPVRGEPVMYEVRPDVIKELADSGRLQYWVYERFLELRATPPAVDAGEEIGLPALEVFDKTTREMLDLRAGVRRELHEHGSSDHFKQEIADAEAHLAELRAKLVRAEELEVRRMILEPLPAMLRLERTNVERRITEQLNQSVGRLERSLTCEASGLDISVDELLARLLAKRQAQQPSV